MMQLNDSVRQSIDQSVLCWLATSSTSGQPNVSPKEIFALYDQNELIIANIASPESMKNIETNPYASVSVLNIWTQKGHQLKGRARVITHKDDAFAPRAAILKKMTKGLFPFHAIFSLSIDRVKPILAPSYVFFPDTTEGQQIKAAMKTYGVQPIDD